MIRSGQALMNALYHVDAAAYEEITSTEFDCYYDDKNIENCLAKLKLIWSGRQK
jgi:hypothetical protein